MDTQQEPKMMASSQDLEKEGWRNLKKGTLCVLGGIAGTFYALYPAFDLAWNIKKFQYSLLQLTLEPPSNVSLNAEKIYDLQTNTNRVIESYVGRPLIHFPELLLSAYVAQYGVRQWMQGGYKLTRYYFFPKLSKQE